jgi:hypothetical protein
VQGEKLPFDVSDELEQLKAKRAQARTWMDRLKKSLPKANRNTRRVDDRAKPKLDLKEMQQMISEGEQFDIQSKELDQMQSVMMSANEWVSRVREMLESGDAAELEALNELLGEADDIPVVMEEVQLLRAQMEGIRWSEKLGKVLAKKKPTLQEAQKLLKEVRTRFMFAWPCCVVLLRGNSVITTRFRDCCFPWKRRPRRSGTRFQRLCAPQIC